MTRRAASRPGPAAQLPRPTAYAYDNNGNRTKAGATSYAYDARDELTGDGTSTYSYTANGDLSSVAGPSGTVASTSDAYGQQATQGTQGDTYDALGRDVQLTSGSTTTSLSYQGNGGQLVSDGGSHYTWTPDGTLTGTAPAAGGTGALDLTDAHTDGVAQFTAGRHGSCRRRGPTARVGRGQRQLHQCPGGVAGLPVAVHQPCHRADQHGRPLVQPRHRRLREQGHGLE